MRKRDCELLHKDRGTGVRLPGPGPAGNEWPAGHADGPSVHELQPPPSPARSLGPHLLPGHEPHQAATPRAPRGPAAGSGGGEPRRPRIPSPECGDAQTTPAAGTSRNPPKAAARPAPFTSRAAASGLRKPAPAPLTPRGPGTGAGRRRAARTKLSICAGRPAARPAEVTSRISAPPEGRSARKRPWSRSPARRKPVRPVEGAGRAELIGQHGMAPGRGELFLARGPLGVVVLSRPQPSSELLKF